MSGKNFKVYKSSAGSGKTFTLVKEFLKHCLKSNDHYEFSRILAITFTNKATYEMKARVLTALKQLSEGDPKGDQLKSTLMEETSLTEIDLVYKCQQVLTAILHNYADFGISTIDKFTHRLIRTFSKDLQLSPLFSVELDEKRLLGEVIDTLIDSVGRDDEITQLILRFTEFRMDEEKRWKVDEELIDFSTDILQEKATPFLKELRELTDEDYQKTIKSYRAYIKGFEKKIEVLAQTSSDLIKKEGILHESFSGNSKISKYFEKLLTVGLSGIEPSKQLITNIEKDNWFSGKCTAEQKDAIERIKDSLSDSFQQIQELKQTEYPSYIAALEVLKLIHSLSLLNQIEKKLAAYKKEEKLLNISDFNKIISEVVMNEPMPFIYERLGERYRNIMIDEFQDTSVLQFMNLLPLIEDSLSRGNENLIVGDAKQAIYRFRGGEVEQFSEMPDYVPSIVDHNIFFEERMQVLKSQYNTANLNVNWRSSATVVNFNNSFFDYVKQLPSVSTKIKSIFDEHQQNLPKEKTDGYVEISFSEGITVEEREEIFHEKTMQSIEECLTDGFKLRDIAILFRAKKQASAMANYLKLNDVEVISSEALLLNNDLNIQFLLNFARWIHHAASHLVQKEVVEYFHEKGLLKNDLEESFEKYTGDVGGIGILFEELGFSFSIDRLKLKAPVEFFESCIRIFRLDETYSVYLQSLQDAVLDFSRSTKGNLLQFVEWWGENSDRLSLDVPDDLDAVTLMTVHKSKGLEFPVVIIPYADFKIKHSGSYAKKYLWTETTNEPSVELPFALVEFTKKLKDSSIAEVYHTEYEKNQIDLVNVSYVAFTRAADRLYIHTELPKKSKTERDFNLPDLIYDFVQQNKIEEKEENVFFLGEKLKVERASAINKTENPIELDYISASWEDKLSISLSHKSRWKESDEILYGTLLHEILGEIEYASDVERVLKDYEFKGIISKDEQNEIESKLTSLLSNANIKQYFSTEVKVKKEATILDQSGKLLRPDRVVFMDNRVVVLDYKTGDKNESHHKQINQYIHAIKETTLKPVEGYVLYTETEEIEQV